MCAFIAPKDVIAKASVYKILTIVMQTLQMT
jgi:hypothetical protein